MTTTMFPTSAQLDYRPFHIELMKPCADDPALHAWLINFLGINVPRAPVCDGHDAPFEYLRRAYVEPAGDIVIWAPRGGGKTRLAAAATLLDLLHKPGISVRILGGSLEQSMRLWEHLLPDIERLVPQLIAGARGRRIDLKNGSNAAVLTQSERAVRGLRVQKLRCDEVNLFEPEIWDAAQLVTRSRPGAAASIEALSTLHTPFGLMSRIVDRARHSKIPIVKWCLMEVLERCEPARNCATCELWDDCRGVAKHKCDGFVSIDDAIAMKKRVSLEIWNSEMMCRKPATRACVFPSFDETVHLRDALAGERAALSLAIDFGFAAPFVCLWIESRADGSTHVIDEYVQPARTIDEHIEQIKARPWGPARRISCDPSGAGRNDHTAASNVQVLRAAGFLVRHRHSHIVDGIEMIRAALRPGAGEPRLYIHSRCARLIRALRAYRYADGGSELPLKDGEHDHPIDALRYHFVNHRASIVTTRAY